MLSDQTMTYAEELTAALLGVDALYRRESGDVDGLVVLNIFAALMTRYRSGIGTAAAWRLHQLGWPADRVGEWLREQTLVGGEGWAANRMRFIEAPQRCALIWSYWHGEAVVAPAWDRVAPARRAVFMHFLYGRMHSPQSVAMFA